MRVEVFYQADLEISEAISYYEKKEPGLGVGLYEEYFAALEWILQNPEALRLRQGNYRRFNLKRFPYGIIYVIRDEILHIIAFAHGRKMPNYWTEDRGPFSE